MAPRTVVVVNPQSGNGSARRAFERLLAPVRERLGPVDVTFTRAPRDAERIAREAVHAGAERLIVAGGDGTMSEVVSGLLAAGLAGSAELGLLPLGTGGDLCRTLGVPRAPEAALDAIATGRVRKIDAGRARLCGPDGEERTVFFANVMSVGISGLVTDLVNRTSKALGGSASFLVGTLRAIVRFRSLPVTISVDGRIVHEGPLVLATAANGRFFGGGMKVAPEACLDDGLLDVVVIPGVSRARLLRELPGIYRGKHLGVDVVSLHRGAHIEATAQSGTVRLEVDGEPLGFLPVVVDALPGALSIVGATG